MRAPLLLIVFVLVSACSSDGGGAASDADVTDTIDTPAPAAYAAQAAVDGPAAKTRLDGGFFERPFPAAFTAEDDGTWSMAGFTEKRGEVLDSWVGYVDGVVGASTQGGIFFPFDAPIDPTTLPADGHKSMTADAGAFVVNVDPDSPDFGRRHPVTTRWQKNNESFSAPNLLTLLPPMGVAMEENTWYAAVITDAVKGEGGAPLGMTPETATLVWALSQPGYVDFAAAPDPVRRMGDEARRVWTWLTARAEKLAAGAPAPIAAQRIRAITVFRTRDLSRGLFAIATQVNEVHGPAATPKTWTKGEAFDTFCSFTGQYDVPIWQQGKVPYTRTRLQEGLISFDEQGRPVQQRTETVRFSFSIPKTPMPPGGWPFMTFAHGMGGNYMNVIHRGREGDPENQGKGPAWVLSLRGIAAGSIDAVHHGARTTATDGTVQGINYFNFFNPFSVGDNTRQLVSDHMMFLHMIARLEIDPAQCPGATAPPGAKFKFDASQFYAMGHSLGSTLANTIGTADHRIRGVISSGAGAGMSFVLSQKTPTDIAATIAGVLGFKEGEVLDPYDPMTTLFQYIYDQADGPVFGRLADRVRPANEKRLNVLQIQGLGDTWTPELTNHAVAAGFGLDIIDGPHSDEGVDRVSFVGGRLRAAAFAGNRGTPDRRYTAALAPFVVTGGIEPHYAAFQNDDAKHLYSCFLTTIVRDGIATVVRAEKQVDAPCPAATP